MNGNAVPDRVAAVYRRHRNIVFLRARRLRPAEAEDVVQEVFVRMLQNPPASLDPDSAMVRSWLLTATTNACLDRIRHAARRNSSWRQSLLRHLSFNPGRDLVAHLSNQELLQRLIADADEQTRQIAVLSLFDEMTQEEIATALGITRKTVAKRLAKLRAKAARVMRA